MAHRCNRGHLVQPRVRRPSACNARSEGDQVSGYTWNLAPGYTYDLAGNRTGGTVNGTPTASHSYDSAHKVIGWTYDAAGNLTSDGTTNLRQTFGEHHGDKGHGANAVCVLIAQVCDTGP
jgi:YD repeat-containing protein